MESPQRCGKIRGTSILMAGLTVERVLLQETVNFFVVEPGLSGPPEIELERASGEPYAVPPSSVNLPRVHYEAKPLMRDPQRSVEIRCQLTTLCGPLPLRHSRR